MSAKLRIAVPDDAMSVLRLVAACHEEAGIQSDPAETEAAVKALLSNEMPGAVYLIGPPSSPVGYLALSFGHSITMGGTEATIDEIFVRPPVRRRGMATEAVRELSKVLGQHGVRAMHIRLREGEGSFLHRLRWETPERALTLTRVL